MQGQSDWGALYAFLVAAGVLLALFVALSRLPRTPLPAPDPNFHATHASDKGK